ncbi:MAG: IS481 family transposase [Actinomycetaceae bacterium]|nr:IS481 family transposase [Actinomycetaceae bacterium]
MSQYVQQDTTRNEAIVIAIREANMPISVAATRFGVSRRWVHTLLHRYDRQGLPGIQPRSRAPHHRPHATPPALRQEILDLHQALSMQGLDAGAASIHARLACDRPPSLSTIYRILKKEGKTKNEPKKRPRCSWHRFQAPQPNAMWQSDVTHWPLDDGDVAEIISWLDDHSRYLLHASAHTIVTTPTVIQTFNTTAQQHGLPASTLTDNALIYTTRYAHGGNSSPNAFESHIAQLGIKQKNGAPAHPTTQGKIERYHQTLKKWLTHQPPATDLQTLNQQLQKFQHIYNYERPHRALNRQTPATCYNTQPKAEPRITINAITYRIRLDTVSKNGTITLRHLGKLKHLAVGRTWKTTPIILLVNGPNTLVIHQHTGEILAEHTINPDTNYQPKK